jgi:hypothetical protein
MKDLVSLEAPSISLVWENYLGWTLTCHFWAYGLVLDLLFAVPFSKPKTFATVHWMARLVYRAL